MIKKLKSIDMNNPLPIARTILFVTGTRADYGKMEPLALAAQEQGHQVTFFVTGMHMMAQYGSTKQEVHRKNKFNVIEFMNQRPGDAQDIILAKTVTGFSDCIQELRPDLVVIHGDRVEAVACSFVCASNYVRSAHVEGGEVSGTIDEIFRHCTTKLSWAHLVSSNKAQQRILRLGESPQNIHVIGSPELDIHRQASGVELKQVLERYGIKTSDYGICIFHPVTSEQDHLDIDVQTLFDTLEISGRYFVVILPNNDPGSEVINKRLLQLPQESFRVLPSMRFNYFSELMKNAKVIIGNSSVGVREAPFMGVPSIDIGTRQNNRSEALSVHQVQAATSVGIIRAIDQNWGKRFVSDKSFGEGSATESFIKLLSNVNFWDQPLQKHFYEEDVV